MAAPRGRNTSRRPYHSPSRQRQAEETRARILDSARETLRSLGYAATTIDAIASGAQVSAKTVEAAFGSKRAILAALVDPLATAGPPRDLVRKLGETDDPLVRLQLVAELTLRAYERAVPEFELLRGATAVAPEMAAVAHQVEARRRANQTRLTSWLYDCELLRRGLDLATATDIMWSLTSYDIFRALVIERDWPAERYQNWLATTLIAQLVEPGTFEPDPR
jgi:AcrR family transcriptional regulator